MLSFSGNGMGNLTASAGTAIDALVPPDRRGVTRIVKAVYTAAATAHSLRVQRPIGNTTVSATGAAGQAVIALTANPGPTGNTLAANDRIAIRHAADGVTRLYTVGSITGLAVTLSANLAVAVAAGDKVWNFGITTDVDPSTGVAHPQYPLTASATTTYEDREVGIAASIRQDEPLLVSSNNATNAGTLNMLTYGYTIN